MADNDDSGRQSQGSDGADSARDAADGNLLQRDSRLKLSIEGEQLDLVRLDCSEGLSQPFLITIEVISTLGEFNLLPHLGKPAMVESLLDGEHMRYFHGVITDGYMLGELVTGNHSWVGSAYQYRLTLQPRAFFHNQGRDFRIYQDKSVIAIVQDVLDRCGVTNEAKLQSGSSGDRVLKYCVQFGESDMAFVYRLLEEHGIYYFYRHDADDHVMVLADAPSAHKALAYPQIAFNPYAASTAGAGSALRSFSQKTVTIWHEHLNSGGEAKASMRDYDFQNAPAPREANFEDESAHEVDAIEVYDWPGRYYQPAEGTKLATYVLQSRRAQRVRYDGQSAYTGLRTGYKFTLSDHPIERFNSEYLVIATHTSLATEAYRSGGGSGSNEVHFSVIPAVTKFRAPIVTPRPVARGPETAVVVGPQGEEIYVDKFARIKVQFHWDRLGSLNEQSSCWIRVSQTGGLGNIIIPRIGHEVLVDFINGDPDRPIVVGRVFNDTHMPIYGLPANKTRAVWRSKTYQHTSGLAIDGAVALDTGAPGANEIRMEDIAGGEEFFVHAEKDLNTRVRNCETHKVGKDVDIFVGKNRSEEVGENEKIKIGNDRSEEVGQNENIKIGMNRTEEVQSNETVTIHGDRKNTVDGKDTTKISGKVSITCDDEVEITVAKKITVTIGMTTVTLDPSSFKLSTVQFEADGTATAKLSAAMTTVEASGVLTAQGTMVKIN